MIDLWRTDAGDWFATKAQAELAAQLTPTKRYGRVPIDAAELLGILSAAIVPGAPVEPTHNLAGIPPYERGYLELIARGIPQAVPGYVAHA